VRLDRSAPLRPPPLHQTLGPPRAGVRGSFAKFLRSFQTPLNETTPGRVRLCSDITIVRSSSLYFFRCSWLGLAAAMLPEVDFSSPGDGLITRDTETQLELAVPDGNARSALRRSRFWCLVCAGMAARDGAGGLRLRRSAMDGVDPVHRASYFFIGPGCLFCEPGRGALVDAVVGPTRADPLRGPTRPLRVWDTISTPICVASTSAGKLTTTTVLPRLSAFSDQPPFRMLPDWTLASSSGTRASTALLIASGLVLLGACHRQRMS